MARRSARASRGRGRCASRTRFAIEIADGLEHAHRRGIIHRDIKPDNVLLADGHAMVTDFGIAHALREAGGERLTLTGVAVGTPAYMSPEQAAAEREIDARADVFSLACVLHEMLLGEPPFAGPSLAATLSKVLTADVAPIAGRRADVPTSLDAVLARAFEKDPARRHASASDFSAELRDVLAEVTRRGSGARARSGQATRMRVAATAGTMIAIAATVVSLVTRRGASEAPSVAVLPFANESSDSADAYVGAGIAEELLTALADVPGLRVASRTSSFAVGTTPMLRDLAHRLGVKTVLEGSVRRAGGTLRVTARLVDAERDTPIWSESFDRPVADVFQVQEDIARSIVQKLRVRLAAGDAPLVRRRTSNAEAHDLVLRARAASAFSRRDSLLEAAELLRQAETLDSTYAEVFAQQARVYTQLAIFRDQARLPDESGMSAGEMLRRARVAAGRAVRLDDGSAAAHVSLAEQLFRYEWDWNGAVRELGRARALTGTSEQVFRIGARIMRSLGRFPEAYAMLDTADRVAAGRSMGASGGQQRGRVAYFAHDFARAVRDTRADSVGAARSRTWAVWYAQALLASGRGSAADSLVRARPDGEDPGMPTTRALVAAAMGRTQDARAILARIDGTDAAAPTLVAGVLAALGDTTAALAEVRRAIETRDPLVVDMKVDPRLDPLRGTAEFRRVMAALRFP
jgi:serine/threonine-protein kinase